MPERMSDGKFNELWQRAAQGAADRHDAYDLAHETARARAEVEEKDAQIKALADALEAERELTGVACECHDGYKCVSCRGTAALKAAGRG